MDPLEAFRRRFAINSAAGGIAGETEVHTHDAGDISGAFSSITVTGDIWSSNWDGSIPADLSAGPDAAASVGFYLDSSAGAIQSQSLFAEGGQLGGMTVVSTLTVGSGGGPIIIDGAAGTIAVGSSMVLDDAPFIKMGAVVGAVNTIKVGTAADYVTLDATTGSVTGSGAAIFTGGYLGTLTISGTLTVGSGAGAITVNGATGQIAVGSTFIIDDAPYILMGAAPTPSASTIRVGALANYVTLDGATGNVTGTGTATFSGGNLGSLTVTGTLAVGSININGATGQIAVGTSMVIDDAPWITMGAVAGAANTIKIGTAANYVTLDGTTGGITGSGTSFLSNLAVTGTLTLSGSGTLTTAASGQRITIDAISFDRISFYSGLAGETAGRINSALLGGIAPALAILSPIDATYDEYAEISLFSASLVSNIQISVRGSITPSVASTFSLGYPALPWLNLHANAIYDEGNTLRWDIGTAGAGNSLDADLLDGNHAAAFALLTGATFSGDITISDTLTLTSAGGVELTGYTAVRLTTTVATLQTYESGSWRNRISANVAGTVVIRDVAGNAMLTCTASTTSGSVTSTIPVLLPDGSDAIPSLAFASDTDVGFRLLGPGTSPGPAIIASVSGTKVLTVHSGGIDLAVIRDESGTERFDLSLCKGQSYTPTLASASDPQPNLGAGTISGYYYRLGKMIWGWVQWDWLDLGVVAGTGVYAISLPVTASASLTANTSSGQSIGGGRLYSSAGTDLWLADVYLSTTTAVRMRWDQQTATGAVTATSPYTPISGDYGRIYFQYEAA